MTQATEIPPRAAERFAFTFTDFVTAARTALALAPPENPDVSWWQRKAMPLLGRDLEGVDAAIESYKAGDPQPLVRSASSTLSLAKNLDGFPLNFAGEETGNQLAEKLRFVVMAAWQVVNVPGRS